MKSVKHILHAHGAWVLIEDTSGDYWRINAENGEFYMVPVNSVAYRKVQVGEFLTSSEMSRLYIQE